MKTETLSRLDQEILLRHRTGIILPAKATSEDLVAVGLVEETIPPTRVPFGSKQFFDELGVDNDLRGIVKTALAKPPTREELKDLGRYASAEIAGLLL